MLVTMTAFGPQGRVQPLPSASHVLGRGNASAPRNVDTLAARYLEEIKLMEGEPVSDPALLLKLTNSRGWIALALAGGSIVTGLGRVGGVLMQVGS